MTTILNANEIGELTTLRTSARSGSIGYWEIYQWLADKLEEKDDVSLKQTIQWLRGATEVNASRGAFSALIRAYTEKQYSLRTGGEVSDEMMLATTNKIAENLLRDILGDSLDWRIGLIPDIDRIAKADATAVGEVLFNQDIQDTAAAPEQNSAWSGTLLFSILGSDQRGRLTSTGASSKIDTLSDVRDVLYACVSYTAGLKAARGAISTQPATDLPIIGSAIWNNYIIGPGTTTDLWATVVAGAGGNPLKSTFSLIRSIGPNRFLEMLVGAADGESIIGSIDDASFDSKARVFFQSRTSVQLKNTPATIYTTAAEVGTAARTDVNARVALSALSLVSFRVDEDVASQFSLFNEKTGQGTITQQWMRDRTEMLQWLSVKIAMGTDGPVTTVINGPGTRYLDTSSGTEVITGTLPVDRRQFIFGGDGKDTITGQDLGDHLYGGNEDDVLSGGKGDDYLQGDDGADKLEGGEGSDTLIGGNGSDDYVFSGDFGADVIVDSDGQIMVDGQKVEGENARKIAENIYKDTATGWTFKINDVQLSGHATLFITQDGLSGRSITVRNWQNGNLGIILNDTQQEGPTGMLMFKGDQRPLIYGVELTGDGKPQNTYAWDQVSWNTTDGTLQGQATVEAGFADVINGTTNADHIQGLGGNDALNGGGGGDKIDGGDGNDLIGGGAGSDTISGGAGADYIFGGFNLSVSQRQPTDSWSPPSGSTTVIKGENWGVYQSQTYYATTIQGALLGSTDDPDVISGGAGDDVIYGSQGSDVIDGGSENDEITGLGGNDAIDGGDGNDFVFGDGDASPNANQYFGYLQPAQMGNDFINGGSGDDQLIGQGGRDSIFGDADNDKIFGDDQDAWQTPEDRHDNDYLDGGNGNDSIWGGGKDDVLYGGAGNDSMLGDDVGDKVSVAIHGSDYLDGEAGNDVLLGGGGDDELYGGTENDELRGDDSQDRVAVSAHGNDYLDGEEGDDTLHGDGGNDTLYGGDGADRLFGDARQYEVAASAHGSDFLAGEQGADVLLGGGGDDILLGGADNDTLWGDDEEQYVDASAHGNDYLDGGEGADQLVGNGGDDTLIGGGGNDKLFGDAPSEMLTASAHGNDYLDGGDGDDTLVGGGGDDVLIGGAGADTLLGDSGTNELYGGDGDDLLVSTGADILDGGAGNDTYIVSFGSAGGKTLLDTVGANVVQVDVVALDDVAWTEHRGSRSTGLSSGLASLDLTSQLYFPDAMRVSIAGQEFERVSDLKSNLAWKITGGDGDDEIIGSARSDTLSGGIGNDTLIGGTGSDDLFGDDGDDVLQGGEGEDYLADASGRNRLEGGAARDVLQGGDHGDTLIGGTGNDLVIGGRGSDVYEFNAGDGEDAITDLGGEDTIRFGAGLTLDNLTATANRDLTLTFQTGEQLHIRFGALGVIEKFEFADGRVLRVDELIRAVAPDDGLLLDTPEEGGTVFGGPLHDTLQGSSGDDTLIGWAGNDVMAGGAGADTYVFQSGSGTDTVIDVGGDPNCLHFTDLVDAGSLTAYLEYEGQAPVLVLSRSDTGDQVRINNAQSPGIESLKLADSSVVDFASWLATQDLNRTGSDGNNRLVAHTGGDTLKGLDGADTLTGSSSADHLLGGAGDDVLIGQGGQDTYDGGAGDDAMLGGQGADEYVWGSSQGHDRIIDASVGNRIRLLPGTEHESLIFVRNGDDLQMLSADRSASVTIEGHFSRATDWTLFGADDEEASISQLYAQSLASDTDVSESQRLTAAQAAFMADAATRRQAEFAKMSDQYGNLAPDSLDDFDSLGMYTATGTLAGNPNITATLIADMSTKQLVSNANAIDIDGGPYWGARRLSSVTTGWVMQTNTTVVLEYVYPEPVVLRFIPAEQMPTVFRHEIGEYIPVIDSETNGILGYNQMKLPEPGDYQIVKNYITSTTTVAQKSVTDRYDLGLAKLAAGDAGNTITFNYGNLMVDAGGGDDVIRADTHPFTRLRYETYPLDGPAFLYGNSGNDTIIGSPESDTIMGGKGDDKLNGAAGADTYLIGAHGGWDVVLDSGSQSINAYVYEGSAEDFVLMNELWEANQVDGEIPFTSAMLATFLSFQQSRDENSVVMVIRPYGDFEKWIGFEGEPWSLHLNGIPLANDQDWLALTYHTNQLPLDTIEFSEGIALSDLALAYGSQTIGGRTYRTLDISLPDGGGTHVILADSTDAIGFGIERFRFADGSVMTLADMLYQIPIVGTTAGDRMAPVDRRNRLQGGEGDDTYVLNSILQSEVIEEVGGGIDTIETTLPAFDLRNHANVENLKLTANQPDEYASWLIGNELNNVIEGANSDDIIQGGEGNDTIVSYDGNDILHGGPGDDVLEGGAGDDTYYFERGDGRDTVNESYTEDSVIMLGDLTVNEVSFTRSGANLRIGFASSATDRITLADFFKNGEPPGKVILRQADGQEQSLNAAELIQLSLVATNSADVLEGSSQADTINGLGGDDLIFARAGNDVVDGGAGRDLLYGAEGDDELLGGVGDDTLYGGTGADILRGGADQDQLYGGDQNDTLYGDDDNDVLDGEAGIDHMHGGGGDDTYYVDSAFDRVIELANGGLDTVLTSVSYVVPDHVEAITLLGDAAINIDARLVSSDLELIGNDAENRIEGGSGHDYLDGGAGVDTLVGGAGDDYYVLTGTGPHDVIIEQAGGGTDGVWSYVNTTHLADHVEQLTMLGTASSAFGNDQDNIINGNSRNNVIEGGAGLDNLYGRAGNDTLRGGVGDDYLIGGEGNDTYLYDRGDGWDYIQNNDSGGVDTLSLSGIREDQLWLKYTGSALELQVVGTEDGVVVQSWRIGSANKLDSIVLTDSGKMLAMNKVDALVQAMAGFQPPAIGESAISGNTLAALQPTLASSWV